METGNRSHSQMHKQASPAKQMLFAQAWFQSTLGIFAVISFASGFLLWQSARTTIAIDKSQISAPIINLAPQGPGTLDELYVNEGDSVRADTPLARVGTQLITAKTDGIVITVRKDKGKLFNAGETVISMINPQDMRVVGKLDEDKGLDAITVGQPAAFTVDAFGNTQFSGVVDEISPTSNQTGVVFSISDKREIRQFDIKVRFNVAQHPELKNGMSARLWISVK